MRLLDVLETALAAPLGERAEAEVVALAEHALDMAGRRLDELAPPAPIDLLVGWLELGTAGRPGRGASGGRGGLDRARADGGSDLDDPEERRAQRGVGPARTIAARALLRDVRAPGRRRARWS